MSLIRKYRNCNFVRIFGPNFISILFQFHSNSFCFNFINFPFLLLKRILIVLHFFVVDFSLCCTFFRVSVSPIFVFGYDPNTTTCKNPSSISDLLDCTKKHFTRGCHYRIFESYVFRRYFTTTRIWICVVVCQICEPWTLSISTPLLFEQ